MFKQAAAFLALATFTSAHVSISPNTAEPGTFVYGNVHVPHGCKDSPTVNVTVIFPKNIKYQGGRFESGWKTTLITRPATEEEKAQKLEKVVTGVTFSGNKLPSDLYGEFQVSFLTPKTEETLIFPVHQICEQGEQLWIGTPDDKNSTYPAPLVKIGKKSDSATGSKDEKKDEKKTSSASAFTFLTAAVAYYLL